jgi:hypothetical protein
MRALATLLLIVCCIFGQDSINYNPILNMVADFHTQQAAMHKSEYVWHCIDLTTYPFWCVDTPPSIKQCTFVYGTKNIMIHNDILGLLHAKIATISYLKNRVVPPVRIFHIFFFYQDSIWKVERPPLRTIIKLNRENNYFYCGCQTSGP